MATTTDEISKAAMPFRLGDEVRVGTELGIVIGLPQPVTLGPPPHERDFPPGLFIVAVQDRIMALAAELMELVARADSPEAGHARAAAELSRIVTHERETHWTTRRPIKP